MYMQDNDDAIGEVFQGGYAGVSTPTDTWMGTLQPYIKNKSIFRCPSASSPEPDLSYAGRGTVSVGMNRYLGWIYNAAWFLAGEPQDPTAPRPITDALIAYPANTVFAADSFYLSGSKRSAYIDIVYGKGVPRGISDRHQQGSNLTFIDGHSKFYKTNAVLSQKAIDDNLTSGSDADYARVNEEANYNGAGVIWDVTADNMNTAPGKWPTACCKD